jgi:hypothetical protein
MPFKFINNADIDHRARKLIRSHAAKGKNVGKKLQRRKRTEPRTTITTPSSCSQSVDISKTAAYSQYVESYNAVLTIERQLGDALSVLPIPEALITTSRGLIQQGTSLSNR